MASSAPALIDSRAAAAWRPSLAGALGDRFGFVRPISPWAFAGLLALGAAAAIAPPLYAGAAVLGAMALVLVLVRPDFGLYFLGFTVPFQSLRGADPTEVKITATEIVVAVTVCAFLLRKFAIDKGSWRSGPLVVPLLFFLAAMMLSVFKATSALQSLKELVKWLELLVVYWMAVNLLREKRRVAAMVAFIVAAALVEVGIGAAQVVFRLGPQQFLIGGVILRAYGTFGQPNPFAGYLNLTLPLLVAIALFTRSRGLRFCCWLAALGVGVVMVTTLSRGAWLGFAVAAIVMGVIMSRRVAVWIWLGLLGFAIVVLAAVFGVIPFGITERVLSAFGLAGVSLDSVTAENFSAVQRLAFWQAGVNMFSANPIFGVGIGNYIEAYPTYAAQGWEEVLGHAHDYYLNAAAEAGILGLTTYLVFLVTAFRHTWQTVRKMLGGVWYGVALGLLGALTAISVHNLVDNMYVHGLPVLLGLLLGLVTVLNDESEWEVQEGTLPEPNLDARQRHLVSL